MNLKILEPIKRNGEFRFYAHNCDACGCGFFEKNNKNTTFSFTCPCCGYQYECRFSDDEATMKELIKEANKNKRQSVQLSDIDKAFGIGGDEESINNSHS